MARARRRFCAAATAIVFLACVPTSAAAQGPSSSLGADDAFQRGLACYDAGDYACAITVWETLLTTLDEQRAWKLLFNLGLAHQSAGDVTGAIERYETFLHKLAEQPARLDANLEAKRLEVVDRVKRLKVTNGAVHVLAHASREVLARVDGDAPRSTGFTVYVPPGEHVVEVRPGTAQVRRIAIRASAGNTVDVDPADPPPPPTKRVAEARPASPPPKPPSFPTGWIVAGVIATSASTALPIGLALVAKSKKDDAVVLGAGSTQYAAAVDRFHSARTAAEITWIVPAVLAAATVLIVLLELPRDEPAHAAAVLANGVAF